MARKRSKTKPRPAATGTPAPADEAVPNRWTFLTNHSHVLIVLAQEPSVLLRQIASRVGITERAVQHILSELEEGGFIERERVGRRNHYRVHTDRALRHPIEEHRTIGDIVDLICG